MHDVRWLNSNTFGKANLSRLGMVVDKMPDLRGPLGIGNQNVYTLASNGYVNWTLESCIGSFGGLGDCVTSLVTATSCKCDTDFHTSDTFTPPAHRKHITAAGNRPSYKSHTSAQERITQGRINKTDKGTPHDRQSKSVNSVTPINVGGVQGTDKC